MPNAVTGPTFKAGEAVDFNDGSNNYANAGNVISFYHLPSKMAVYFKAFITNFNETFSSDWASESVYGRADPIYMFKQTRRNINLAFKIPAASPQEAYENLARVQALAQFLYPTYVRPDEAQTITQSPLVRLKVLNLLRNTANGGAGAKDIDGYSSVCGGSEAANGVLGVIESIAIDHSLTAPDGVIELGGSTILSKVIEINLNFSVIHEHSLGWDEKNNFSTPSFPYGATAGEGAARAAAPSVGAPLIPAPTPGGADPTIQPASPAGDTPTAALDLTQAAQHAAAPGISAEWAARGAVSSTTNVYGTAYFDEEGSMIGRPVS